jgi:glutathione synthase/RimK-type ligase-like ATP-grasp enzyme
VTKIALATSRRDLPPSDQALAHALSRRGVDVHAVIWSDSQCRWQEFDLVVVRSCWDYHLRVREFLAWIALLEGSGVLVLNSPDLIRWNSDKTYLGDLAANGIAIPDTVFLKSTEEDLDLEEVCATRGWSSAVVKPLISASAHGTERRRSGSVRGPAMVQRYVPSIETEGEWSLVYFGDRFSHAVVKRPRSGDFRVQSAFGGTVDVLRPPEQLTQFATRVLSCLGGRSVFARVDVVLEGPSVQLMELEVIEPELFLNLVPGTSDHLAEVIHCRLLQAVR